MRHDEYKDLLALEAVGALSHDESQTLAMHLASCENCRAELDELTEAAASLAYMVAPVAPSPELRARTVSRVSKLRAQQDGYSLVKEQSPVRPTSVVEKDVRSGYEGFSAWRLLFGTPALRYGAFSALLTIAILSSVLVLVLNRNGELSAEIARLTESLNDARIAAERDRGELVQTREAVEVLTAQEALVVSLAGTEVAPSANAKLAYDRRTGRAVFSVNGLPPAPEGKAYQLWYIADGKPLPGPVFTTARSGETLLQDQVPNAGRNATLFAVTLEPAGGVSAPTGDKYLLGQSS